MQSLFPRSHGKRLISGILFFWLAGSLALVACGDTTTTADLSLNQTATPGSAPASTIAPSLAPNATPVPTSTSTAIAVLPATSTPIPPTPVETLVPQTITPEVTSTVKGIFQPAEPTTGPGSSQYVYSSVVVNRYGQGVESYFLYEPARPNPAKTLPLVVLLHGYAGVNPAIGYNAWIAHLVKRGNIVVFPVYQEQLARDGEKFTDNALAAIQAAITRLQDGTHFKPDLNAFTIIGYSAGGVIATNLTARAAKLGLPVPKALFTVAPGGCSNCSRLAIENFTLAGANELAAIPATTRLLVLVGSSDVIVGQTASAIIWQNTKQIPATNKNYLMAISDDHGSPALVADHGMAVRVPPDAFNYYGTWKLFDGLQSCAIAGKFCEYALGNTPQQRNLGIWSDGMAVTPLKILG
jgi:acetyl esterase/lipase